MCDGHLSSTVASPFLTMRAAFSLLATAALLAVAAGRVPTAAQKKKVSTEFGGFNVSYGNASYQTCDLSFNGVDACRPLGHERARCYGYSTYSAFPGSVADFANVTNTSAAKTGMCLCDVVRLDTHIQPLSIVYSVVPQLLFSSFHPRRLLRSASIPPPARTRPTTLPSFPPTSLQYRQTVPPHSSCLTAPLFNRRHPPRCPTNPVQYYGFSVNDATLDSRTGAWNYDCKTLECIEGLNACSGISWNGTWNMVIMFIWIVICMGFFGMCIWLLISLKIKKAPLMNATGSTLIFSTLLWPFMLMWFMYVFLSHDTNGLRWCWLPAKRDGGPRRQRAAPKGLPPGGRSRKVGGWEEEHTAGNVVRGRRDARWPKGR